MDKILRKIIMMLVVTGLCLPCFASGILLPNNKAYRALSITEYSVDVEVKGQVATTTVTQSFYNHTGRQIEAQYVFPLPKGAAINEFYMTINGKKTKGELLEKKAARMIYTSIVRRMQDPALLEYIGQDLIKVSIFPILPNSKQKIELSYTQTVAYDSSFLKYVYPLKTKLAQHGVAQNFGFRFRLASRRSIKNVYSPTHKIDVTRKSEKEAVVGFERKQQALNKDFEIFWSVSEDKVGIDLMSYREKDKDGYFMLMVTPTASIKKEIEKNVIFAFDTSGSMEGKKIEQAKNALTVSLNILKKGDRFNIVRFSTEAELFHKELLAASAENIKRAKEFVKGFKAAGGTAIDDAMQQALKLASKDGRPNAVVFLTDGLPTVGETDVDAIIKNAKAKNGKARIYTFGVGFDVNTKLLDTIAEFSRGCSEYVKPGENIEVKVGLFGQKIKSPVLTDIALKITNAHVYDLYPKKLPDLFKGGQLIISGRYKKGGAGSVALTGVVGGENVTLSNDVTFKEADTGSPFIERVYSQRRVGYLLGQIRANGEKKELVEEVITLSKKFGIMTPYTAYLVQEDQKVAVRPRPPHRQPVPIPMPRPIEPRFFDEKVREELEKKGLGQRSQFKADDVGLGGGATSPKGKAHTRSLQDAAKKLEAESGADAVETAQLIRSLKEGKEKYTKTATVKRVGGKTFYLVRGFWVDSEYKGGKDFVEIKYGTDAYFDLVAKYPALGKFLAVGRCVIVKFKGTFVAVSAKGKETLSEKELNAFFK